MRKTMICLWTKKLLTAKRINIVLKLDLTKARLDICSVKPSTSWWIGTEYQEIFGWTYTAYYIRFAKWVRKNGFMGKRNRNFWGQQSTIGRSPVLTVHIEWRCTQRTRTWPGLPRLLELTRLLANSVLTIGNNLMSDMKHSFLVKRRQMCCVQIPIQRQDVLAQKSARHWLLVRWSKWLDF